MDLSEYENTTRKLYREVLYMEEEETPPKISIKPTSIDFGAVGYLRSATKMLEVKNIGKIPCAFRFVPLELEELVCPTWLRIGTMTGLLLPDESAAISLTIDIDGEMAAELNQFRPKLEATLILHIGLGKDHFVPVSADYEPTCFANTLSYLTRLRGPIRDVGSTDDLLSEEEAKNAPREVMRLVNRMMSGDGVNVHHLFTTRGDPKIVEIIRECLDTGEDFVFPKDYTSSAISIGFGEALLRLLDSLTEPLVPTSLNAACEAATSKDQGFELLDRFPHVSVNVWISVTAFLHYICQQCGPHEERIDRAKALAAVFAPIVFGDLPGESISPISKRDFILLFIA